jgi:hypothetical protein
MEALSIRQSRTKHDQELTFGSEVGLRLLRRKYGVRLRRSGRSEQDDPSINDHARGRLARRTVTSRFSRRIFQDHAQLLLLIWEQRKGKATPYIDGDTL